MQAFFQEKYYLQKIVTIFPNLKFFWFLQETLNSGGKQDNFMK